MDYHKGASLNDAVENTNIIKNCTEIRIFSEKITLPEGIKCKLTAKQLGDGQWIKTNGLISGLARYLERLVEVWGDIM